MNKNPLVFFFFYRTHFSSHKHPQPFPVVLHGQVCVLSKYILYAVRTFDFFRIILQTVKNPIAEN